MPSIELSKLQAVTAPRALSDTDQTIAKAAPGKSGVGGGGPAPSGVSLEVNGAINSGIDAASAPVDTERVTQIKNALRDGTYPLIPVEIADAMIAAQVSFGMEK